MYLKEIKKILGFDIIGNSDEQVKGITFAYCAEDDDIAIIDVQSQATTTKAKVLLTNRMLLGTGKVVVLCNCPVYKAADEIAKLFVRFEEYEDYKVQPEYILQAGHYLLGKDTVVGKGTSIGALATISSGVCIGKDCRISEHVYIAAGSYIGDNVVIRPGARIASPAFFRYDKYPANDFVGYGKVIIEDNVTIGANTIIQRGSFSDTSIGQETGIGDGVVIGHDVKIGRACRIVSQVGIAGNVVLEDGVEVLGQAGIAENIRVGSEAVIKAKSLVSKNVPECEVISGLYGRKHTDELRLQAKLRTIL